MIAESAASRGLLELVRRVARASSSVLVQGESGTGKEFVARLLHYWSDRVGAPFVAVNCAALAPGVLESELFGHERGAFTGALAGARRLLRARPRRHALPRRDRRDAGRLPGQAAARAPGRRGAARRRVEAARTSTCAWWPPPIATCATPSPPGASARTSTSGSTSSRSQSSRCARAARTSCRSRASSWRGTPSGPLALSAEAEARLHRARLAGERARARERDRAGGDPGARERASSRRTCCSSRRCARTDSAGGSERASETAASSDALAFAKVAGADGTLQDAVDRATEERVRGALRETSGRRAEAARLLGVERTTLYRLIKRFGIED